MNAEDRIRAGKVVLVFDAPNGPTSRLFKLAEKAADRGIKCVVPVTAHIETLGHLRRKHAADYDVGKIKHALEDAGVRVIFINDDAAANSIIERLFEWFPTDGDWQDAKWKQLYGATRGPTRRAPATIDWFTAAMCPRDAIVVTSDKGAEYVRCERITWERLEKTLRESADA